MTAPAGDEAEKSFEPTQRRLEEARKRGEVPLSADLLTAASYGGFVLAALAFGGGSVLALGAVLATLLDHAAPLSEDLFRGAPQPLWGGLLGRTAAALWPWFALPAAAALLALLAQDAVVFAPQKLQPKLDRVSPLAQLRRRLGADGLVEFGKGLLKVGLYGTVLGLTLAQVTPRLVGTGAQAPQAATLALLEVLLDLLLRIALLALVLGAADLLWQRLSFLRRHRMSRQEVTDEHKESEGDPQLKQQRRQKAIGIAMNRMLEEVPAASVVIVNPTHYAVALRWNRAEGRAPVVVAKGVDEMAARIRERAIEAGVPIRRDPPTARAIYASVGIGEEVARPEWRAVAAAIRFAERLRGSGRR